MSLCLSNCGATGVRSIGPQYRSRSIPARTGLTVAARVASLYSMTSCGRVASEPFIRTIV